MVPQVANVPALPVAPRQKAKLPRSLPEVRPEVADLPVRERDGFGDAGGLTVFAALVRYLPPEVVNELPFGGLVPEGVLEAVLPLSEPVFEDVPLLGFEGQVRHLDASDFRGPDFCRFGS